MEAIEGPIFIEILWQALFPHWHVSAHLLLSWLVMLLLIGMGFGVAGRLRLRPGRLQNLFEMVLDSIAGLTEQIAGPGGQRFLPLFATLFLFILCCNWIGLLPGFLSPTTNLNINAAMALVVILTTEYQSIRHKGLAGYLKHFCGPPYYMAPIFIVIRGMEIFTRPLSLTMRLFGNMLAKEIILGVLVYLITLFFFSGDLMSLLLLPVPVILRPLIILLGVLVGFIQALVFTALAMSYIGEAVATHH